MIKPKLLKSGATIATLSPSWGGPACFSHIFDDGLEVLRNDFGFKIKEFPTTRMSPQELYLNPERRAEDINAAFKDTSVDGIICSIGGDDSVRILQYLDIEGILENPKMIMGYSDATTILCYLNNHGLITYYGSSVMAGFSHLRCFPDALQEYKSVLLGNEEIKLSPFTQWSDSFKDWSALENRGQVSELRTDRVGHRWLKKAGKATGRLWGGCVEVLTMMNNTLAWPEISSWDDIILMLETSEEKPTPQQVGYFLRNFGIQGILQRIKGLILAKPKGYSAEEAKALDEEALKIVVGEFCRGDLNIISNVDFGHTDPRHIMPLGIKVELDSEKESISYAESPFQY